jgi:8-oxo-dGTP pyrophosphatase MutT (NUDIX family)
MSLKGLRGLTYKESPELHLTSSGLVLSASGTNIAAIFHQKEDIWIQPGGHLEQGETPAAAARREVEEETGIEAPAIWKWHIDHMYPIDIDVHEVRCTASHNSAKHVDFRYVFKKALTGNAENANTRWFALEEVVGGQRLPHISRALRKALARGITQDIKLKYR